MRFRVSLVSFLINLNENIFFYPKMRKVYLELFKEKEFKTIVDVGVNKGQTINFFKKLNNEIKVIGFEPNKKLFQRLKKIKYKNCYFHNLGCSNRNGYLSFNENILNESSTFEEVNTSSKWLKKKEKVLGVSNKNMIIDSYKVEVIRLSEFLSEYYFNQIIDLIKVDVEGHEFEVIQGLFPLNNQVNYIQLEEHQDDMYVNKTHEIEKLLSKNGFKKLKIIKHGFGEIYDVIYKNIVL
jgi:FkbM family methyltransferase